MERAGSELGSHGERWLVPVPAVSPALSPPSSQPGTGPGDLKTGTWEEAGPGLNVQTPQSGPERGNCGILTFLPF